MLMKWQNLGHSDCQFERNGTWKLPASRSEPSGQRQLIHDAVHPIGHRHPQPPELSAFVPVPLAPSPPLAGTKELSIPAPNATK
jgi:hypothetical protein